MLVLSGAVYVNVAILDAIVALMLSVTNFPTLPAVVRADVKESHICWAVGGVTARAYPVLSLFVPTVTENPNPLSVRVLAAQTNVAGSCPDE